jgi:rubrerythrin
MKGVGCRAAHEEEQVMRSVEEFLAYAIALEREAADRFGQLADAMDAYGNKEVGSLFRRLSDYSRMHLSDAQARAGFRKIPDMKPDEFAWPGFESPETAAIWAADPFIGRGQALEIALDAEMAGQAFYQNVLDTTDDPEIKVLAKEFAEEENGHVAELQKWIAAHKAGLTRPAEV